MRAIVDAVDAGRIRYLKKLLIDAGLDAVIAESRAWVLNWAYLGRSLSLRGMKSGQLQTIIEDLSRLMRERSRKHHGRFHLRARPKTVGSI